MTMAGDMGTSTSAVIFPPQNDAVTRSFWPSARIALPPVTNGRLSRAASSGARSQPIDVAPINTAPGCSAATTSCTAATKGSGA